MWLVSVCRLEFMQVSLAALSTELTRCYLFGLFYFLSFSGCSRYLAQVRSFFVHLVSRGSRLTLSVELD